MCAKCNLTRCWRCHWEQLPVCTTPPASQLPASDYFSCRIGLIRITHPWNRQLREFYIVFLNLGDIINLFKCTIRLNRLGDNSCLIDWTLLRIKHKVEGNSSHWCISTDVSVHTLLRTVLQLAAYAGKISVRSKHLYVKTVLISWLPGCWSRDHKQLISSPSW